ncbi:MAG: hypothetical protein DMG37_05575 [Acidobacteria bacterium]|nr:MAG: hypothetical protein DMG37_05575 [Acidobacteriota bacterium]
MQRNIALSGALKLDIVHSRGTVKSLELAFPLFHKPLREMLSFLWNGMQQACRGTRPLSFTNRTQVPLARIA